MNNLSYLSNTIIILYIFTLGICIGSFLNVVILRGLKGESFIFSRSKCPKCHNQLKWYMNIPLLSYIFLKGKCAFCKCKISFQYPLIEFITGICFVGIYLFYGFCFKTLLLFIIFSLFILLCATDFKEKVIIDTHAYILLAAGLLYSFLNYSGINIIQSILGAVFGFLIFEALSYIGILLVKYRMFGEGDSLIALGLGAVFGIKNLLIIIPLSILIQGILAIPMLIIKTFKENKKKLSLSYLLVFLSIIYIVFLTDKFNLKIIMTIALVWSFVNIMKEIKNKTAKDFNEAEEKFCIMPFGPALIFASSICIFYLPQIKSLITNYLFN